jgi:ferric-dicitrate binding protein FerR (iron transport regulator)
MTFAEWYDSPEGKAAWEVWNKADSGHYEFWKTIWRAGQEAGFAAGLEVAAKTCKSKAKGHSNPGIILGYERAADAILAIKVKP